MMHIRSATTCTYIHTYARDMYDRPWNLGTREPCNDFQYCRELGDMTPRTTVDISYAQNETCSSMIENPLDF